MLDPSTRSNNLPPGIRAGDIIANRYRLEETIGRGGMGVVVSARHLELDERVAVKFMSPEALSDPEAIARFDREVKASARIKSEYVARVYDAGKLPDGRRFMVLEYLEGEDLSARVHRDGPLPVEQAIRFLLQACSALVDAHALGIVHRDLKPANLRVVTRVDGSEIVKVLDFGIMKRMPGSRHDTDTHETQPGTIVGTPYYTSPEQLRGSTDVDARSDVWSMGATLFELLTGAPPFGGKTFPQVIANVLESSPVSLRGLRPDISEDIDAVVLRCLEKQPEFRYPTVIDFAKDLASTIELDAELRGLLERMLRHQRSSPVNTPVRLDARAAEPSHGAGSHPPESHRRNFAVQVRSANAKEYRTTARRRLLLTLAAAAFTAILVVSIGFPLLPDFRARTKASAATPSPEGPQPTSSLATQPLARITPAQSPDTQVATPPVEQPNPAMTPPVPSIPPAPRRAARSVASTITPAPTRTSAPQTTAATEPVPPTSRPKNPLLVKPR